MAEQLVNKGGFAMIDVRDNGHIAEAHENTLIARNDVARALSAICAVRQDGGVSRSALGWRLGLARVVTKAVRSKSGE